MGRFNPHHFPFSTLMAKYTVCCWTAPSHWIYVQWPLRFARTQVQMNRYYNGPAFRQSASVPAFGQPGLSLFLAACFSPDDEASGGSLDSRQGVESLYWAEYEWHSDRIRCSGHYGLVCLSVLLCHFFTNVE